MNKNIDGIKIKNYYVIYKITNAEFDEIISILK